MHISSKCSVAIHCLLFIHEYSAQGKVTGELIATSAKTNAVTVRRILSALKKDGILDIPAGTGGATIACLPEEITLLRICKSIEPDFLEKLMGVHDSPSANCPIGSRIHDVLDASYQIVRQDLADSLSRITLADVIKNYHRSIR